MLSAKWRGPGTNLPWIPGDDYTIRKDNILKNSNEHFFFRRKAVENFQAITIRKFIFRGRYNDWESSSLSRKQNLVFLSIFLLCCIFRCPLLVVFTTQICGKKTVYSLILIFSECEIVYSPNNKWPFKHEGDKPYQRTEFKIKYSLD